GLAKRATIKKADAEKTALQAVEGAAADKSLGDSELEVVNDYLVYEIDVKVKGKPGLWEGTVDAGSGKVLATEHENGGEERCRRGNAISNWSRGGRRSAGRPRCESA